MTDSLDRIRLNIKLNYVYTALMNCTLDRAIWMLFLSLRGMSLLEIGLIESVYQLAMLLFGIPAGAISDILGRKTSLIIAAIARIAGYTLILFSHSFAGFALGFAVNALAMVLYSSASESFTYDTCKQTGQQVSYRQVYGNVLAVTFIAAAAGIAAGGFIANVSYDWVYYATIGILLCALIPALLFTETRKRADGSRRPRLRELLTRSVTLIAGNPVILYLLVISAAITVIDQTIYMYSQKYFEAMAIPVYFIGLILSADSIFAALGARYAHVLERFSNRDIVIIVPAVILAMYLLFAVVDSPVVVLFLWIATIFVVGFWPILSDLINKRVPSENRATVLSMKAQMNSIAVMIVFPIVGFIAERTSMSLAFIWLIVSIMPLIAYSVMKIRKVAF
ncbi:MFS transporter [Methanocella arvoryzae]|uniref:Permease (Major facilitator superfamily) n=1 Tax=Methanocella arvoryzae (strain DSM 22066 / NBRC 105507 / MRE50) TaxID=351160 RepID=Q0W7K6_METAR|nr:MFS transporter [Methanocella arvoryzae]CAJ35637.1 putative permease (major facilitator superfamily) [Methanocella arvoryzae MRE50]